MSQNTKTPLQFLKHLIATHRQSKAELLLDRKHAINVDVDEEINSNIEKNGYHIIENYLDEAQCDEIQQDIDQLIHDYQDQIWVDEEKSDHRIFGAELASKSISKFHSDDHLKSVGEGYIGTSLVNHMTLAARLEAMEKNLGSGGGWHRDSSYEQQFKAIVYLTDVDENNGPFEYIEGSHTTRNVVQTINYGINNNRYSPEEVDELIEKKGWKKKTFIGGSGMLILTDTRGLHRGKPIQKGKRYALTNYYIGEYKKERFSKYFDSLIIKP